MIVRAPDAFSAAARLAVREEWERGIAQTIGIDGPLASKGSFKHNRGDIPGDPGPWISGGSDISGLPGPFHSSYSSARRKTSSTSAFDTRKLRARSLSIMSLTRARIPCSLAFNKMASVPVTR